MTCQHTLTDYQYGAWHRCRECGAWLTAPVERGGPPKDVVLPATVLRFPSRPHASGHQKEDR